ncbi:unnamed protein product [Dicrocoelium dendriticum]|nr:unnamed protein product [Dicrocoelium dendriticum]
MNTLLGSMALEKIHSDSIRDSQLSEDEQFSLCCLCGQSFPTIRSLHRHINITHEDVADAFDFSTNYSSSSSEEISNLRNLGESPSFSGGSSIRIKTPQCEICLKTFSTLSYLRMHISTVHEGVKAYSCSICDKSYTQKHSLKKHIISAHTNSAVNGNSDERIALRVGQRPGEFSSNDTMERRKLWVHSPLSKNPRHSPSHLNSAH